MVNLKSKPRGRRPPAGNVARESFRLAAVDIGSNSIHMIIAQADADGSITSLWSVKEILGLGRMTFPTHRLSRQAMMQVTAVLRRFCQAAQQRQVESIIAIATSAVREAVNGGDLIERIRRKLGLAIRIVSAREEARLIYLGVRRAAAFGTQPHLIIDVGGGSLEFVVGNARDPALLESRKLGAARMTSQFVKSDPIAPAEVEALRAHYQRELAPVCESILRCKPVKAIGTSGTFENLSAMCADVSGRAGGNGAPPRIERRSLDRVVERLIESDAAARSKMHGLDEKRQDQIVAGALVVQELMRRLSLREIHVCGAALREGILLDYITRHVPDLVIRREIPDPRRRSVITLARRCGWHKIHSEHVTLLCLKLFDELKSLHHLGDAERELIEYGALLHDIGWHIARKQHHKHAQYLILNGDLKNFAEDEIQVIANIARYHRKAHPSRTHREYSEISPARRRIVNVGAALLRIADGLDRSHACMVTGMRCAITKSKIRCTLYARGDAELEVWGAKRKSKWLEHLFQRELLLSVAAR